MNKKLLIAIKILFLLSVFFMNIECYKKQSNSSMEKKTQLAATAQKAEQPLQINEEAGHKVLEVDGTKIISQRDESTPLPLKLEDFALIKIEEEKKIYYNQPIDELFPLLGKPEKIIERRKEEINVRKDDTIIYEFKGVIIKKTRGGMGIDEILYNNDKKYLLKTPRGIGLGDEKEKILELYGQGKEFPAEEDKKIPAALVYWSTFFVNNFERPLHIQFLLNENDKVNEIGIYHGD